jgi:hypothetical protein
MPCARRGPSGFCCTGHAGWSLSFCARSAGRGSGCPPAQRPGRLAVVPVRCQRRPPRPPRPDVRPASQRRVTGLGAIWSCRPRITLVLPPTTARAGLGGRKPRAILSRHDGWRAEARRATLTNAILGSTDFRSGRRANVPSAATCCGSTRPFLRRRATPHPVSAAAFGATLPTLGDTNAPRSASN